MRFVAHQRGAGMAVDDLFHRAAEIDVDQPRAAVGVELRGLGHDLRLAAGELHRHRLLVGAALRHRQRLPGLADRRLACDHLGDDKRGAVPLDQTAKRQIGHPRHWREDDGIFECDRAKRNAHVLIKTADCLRIRLLMLTRIIAAPQYRWPTATPAGANRAGAGASETRAGCPASALPCCSEPLLWFVCLAAVFGRLLGFNAVSLLEPAAEIDIGAAAGAEWQIAAQRNACRRSDTGARRPASV